MSKYLRYAGIAASAVLIVFGVASIVIGANGRSTVRSNLAAEKIVGSDDMTPAAIKAAAAEAGLKNVVIPTCSVAGKAVNNGATARCFAQYMRIHALESSGGLTYAQMGRFVSADDPENPAGTSDEAAAAKDEKGAPISNGARNTWVTETALATALNVSYMAEQIALFGVVVGIALLLSGIGFIILALAVLGGGGRKPRQAERT